MASCSFFGYILGLMPPSSALLAEVGTLREGLLTIPYVAIVVLESLESIYLLFELCWGFFSSSFLGILLTSELDLLELVVVSAAGTCFLPAPIF